MTTKTLQIHLPGGLDARPAAELVQVANRYTSSVYIESGTGKVNAKSIMGMMSLALDDGAEVTVIADGGDESEAMQEVELFLCG